MPWNADLPTTAEWDASVAAAANTLTDTYRTTYLITSDASRAQAEGAEAGRDLLGIVRSRLAAYHAIGRDQLRQRLASIDVAVAAAEAALHAYDSNVRRNVYLFNEAKRALLRALVAAGNGKKQYLMAVIACVEQPLPSIMELVERRYTLAGRGGQQHEIGLDQHYWIEQTHPAHATTQVSRSLGSLFAQWLREAEARTTNQHFYVWLECNNRLATVGDPSIVVEYLQAADLPAFELHVNAGRVQRARSRADRTLINYDTTGYDDADMAAFVIAPDRRVYSGQHQRGLFHHSSFLAGGKVLCAGLMSVQAGVVRVVTPKSGHYKATMRDFLSGLQILEQAQIIGPDVLIDLDFWKNKYVANVPVENLIHVLDARGRLRLPLATFRQWAQTELCRASGLGEIGYTMIIRKFHPALFAVIQREVKLRRSGPVLEAAVTNSAEWRAAQAHGLRPLDPALALRAVHSLARWSR